MGVKVAFVGAGRMAREHARAFADVPGVELAGIASRTREKAEALASDLRIARVCDSIEALHRETGATLVVVAVPEPETPRVVSECLRLPWTLLIEKPPGLYPEQTRAMEKEASAQGRAVYVAFNRRFMGSTRAALADLDSRSGESRFVQVLDQQDLSRDPGPWHGPEVRKQWMFANSIHVIDYLRTFGRGDVVRVQPMLRWTPSSPGVVLAGVEFESGDSGVYQGIWNGPGPWAVAVHHPAVRWEMRPLEHAARVEAGTRAPVPVPADPWDTAFKPGFRRQAEAVLDAVRGEKSDAVTLSSAAATMDLIARIFAPT